MNIFVGTKSVLAWPMTRGDYNVYRGQLTFGHALDALKAGERVSRAGWNGKGMWLTRINGNANFAETFYEQLPYIAMKTADNKIVPWLASQTDMLAEDWSILE